MFKKNVVTVDIDLNTAAGRKLLKAIMGNGTQIPGYHLSETKNEYVKISTMDENYLKNVILKKYRFTLSEHWACLGRITNVGKLAKAITDFKIEDKETLELIGEALERG